VLTALKDWHWELLDVWI